MPIDRVWLAAVAACPVAFLCAYLFGVRGRRLYRLATGCAAALTVVAALPLLAECLGANSLRFTPLGAPAGALGERFSSLSIVLVPFASLLWLMAVVVTPAGRSDESGLARTALACVIDLLAFTTVSPVALMAVWIAGSLILIFGQTESRYARARLVAVAYLGLSTALLVAGITLAFAPAAIAGGWRPSGVALILAAVLIRKGIFPFHAWIPETFDAGRIGPAARFNAPQIGTYVALVLAVPYANAGLLRAVAVLGLVTAVYGALMALYQTDARRACGYLFVSQSALVFAGLDLPSREALIGALILWVCAGVALAGLSRAVLALESRRGRLRLDVRHGGYERMPQLAVCFLVMSLAIANFPGTLGFVGGEMLVRGAVDTFPTVGLFAVAAAALAGLAAIRMYFSLFCGRRDEGAYLELRRGEAWGFAAAAVVLLGFGLAPGGLVRVLAQAGSAVVDVRANAGLGTAK